MADAENNLNSPDIKPEGRKFSGSLFFYILVFMCVNIAAFVFFMLQTPPKRQFNSRPDLFGFQSSDAGTQNILLISEIKTHDDAAQNLFRYVMNNPVKPENRGQMAKNLQESGVDLYQKNLEILSEWEDGPETVYKDVETLKSYCSLNKELFTILKTSVEEGKDISEIESGELKEKIDSLSEEVQEIYERY